MTLKLSVLFLTPLLSGLLIYLVKNIKSTNFKLLLVFAGAYLFGITVVHILPELYRENQEVELIGLFVLMGFFLQQVLEYFSSGVEHGHIHIPHDHKHDQSHGDHHHHTHHHSHNHTHHHDHTHHHGSQSAIVLMIALCIHAFLEGGMLVESSGNNHYDSNSVLLGIALHRAPAAFALMTVLVAQLHSRAKAMPYLFIFSIAAPVGLLLSTYFVQTETLSERGLVFLYALVSGNFLHISTTIVFESSPEHRFNARKLAVAVAGALAAVMVEYMIS